VGEGEGKKRSRMTNITNIYIEGKTRKEEGDKNIRDMINE
jgi:hypothetical protein